jgi:hypothetical protein
MNIIYKEIADLIDRTEANIKYMKKHNPMQLELITIGAICKKYNIDLKDLELIVKLKNDLKDNS